MVVVVMSIDVVVMLIVGGNHELNNFLLQKSRLLQEEVGELWHLYLH